MVTTMAITMSMTVMVIVALLIPVNCVNTEGNAALKTRDLHCGTLYMTTQLLAS